MRILTRRRGSGMCDGLPWLGPSRTGGTSMTEEKPAAASSKQVAADGTRSNGGQSESRPSTATPNLLSGGNPQIAKADGDAPVQAYLAAMPGWKGDIGRRLDALIVRTVPDVQKAVKWNSPFYGIEDEGWFASFHTFTKAVKLTFFAGTSLEPMPPGGKAKDARWIDIHEDDLDETQVAAWIERAAELPGWNGR